MSLMVILQTLLIGPLKLIFEIIFVIADRLVKSPGLAIIALSMIINVMMLPLHRRADIVQEQARDKEAKLKPGVDHIKKTFSGDERMMILQTYYRQNNYRPTDALNGSVSLLLEVPFFMAAYQFLSNLSLLRGMPFGPIADLGAPDGMLVIGAVTVNVLPIAMTAINIASGAIYSKGFPLKTKLQMYGLALVFLVLLYDSPSGLVFYWTLNNLFSLGKNLVLRIPGGKKAGSVLLAAAGIAVAVWGAFYYPTGNIKLKLMVTGIGIGMMLPLASMLLKGKLSLGPKQMKPNKSLFWLGAVFLTILTGMLIPSTFIAASPQEYVDISYFHDPNRYVVMATCLAAGTFLVWMGVFYWLASDKGKIIFGRLVWVLCGVMFVNYMFFGRNLGILLPNLQYSNVVLFTSRETKINLITVGLLIPLLWLLVYKWEKAVVSVLLTAALAIGGMSGLNMATTFRETRGLANAVQGEIPQFTLSQNGKNVVVIMLDRAIGPLVPYLFNEKPELQEQFDGFTYYDNTISFGGCTVVGSPAVVGGYEYTPVEMNKRSEEAMVDKHNEAITAIPLLFSQNDYQVTLLNPVYANYQWIPDLSIYEDYPEIQAYLTNGVFVSKEQKQAQIEVNYRNFFCFSIMKSIPIVFQRMLYQDGRYNQAPTESNAYVTQSILSTASSEGYMPTFMDEYSVLCNMDTMTRITEESENTYLFLYNGTTHEPMLLQTPDYVPAEHVDNTEYEQQNSQRFTLDGRTLNVGRTNQMSNYHVNMAALLKLGQWFDYLRENNVYDNTRIIVVSDHGLNIGMFDELLVDTVWDYYMDLSSHTPLLMVKDFDSHGFAVSSEFMTNADVASLSVEGVIADPVNPFTGKRINSEEKYAHDQMVSTTNCLASQLKNTFLPGNWASVKDDFWDSENWKFINDSVVLQENKLP